MQFFSRIRSVSVRAATLLARQTFWQYIAMDDLHCDQFASKRMLIGEGVLITLRL